MSAPAFFPAQPGNTAMPCVELYQSKKTGDIVLCSFVFCRELGGGYTPTGPLVQIPLEHFTKNAADIVNEEFDRFYTRGYGIKSELYDELGKAEQKRFLSEHAKAIISWPVKTGPVNIYIGQNEALHGKLDFPFDKATFADYILEALANAG
jgi:hypothetical protein